MFKPGTYVIDTADSGRYDRAVYRVKSESGDRTLVCYLGSVRNGRIEHAREQPETYRATAKLREWNG